jgi:hypothetical protein
MRRRRFIDAPDGVRCAQTIYLRDGSGAQCGRARTLLGPLCTQHKAMLARSVSDSPQNVSLGAPTSLADRAPCAASGMQIALLPAMMNGRKLLALAVEINRVRDALGCDATSATLARHMLGCESQAFEDAVRFARVLADALR